LEIIYISLTGIISLLSLVFGIRVFLANKKSIVNRAFAIFTIATAVWMVLDFSLYQSSLANIQTFLNRLNLASICILVFTLAYFVTVFPKEIFKPSKLFFYPGIALTVIMSSIILSSDSIIKYAFMEDYGSNFKQGDIFFLFAIFATVFALYSAILLVIKFIKFKNEERQQIKYLFYGIAFLTVLNLLFNLFIPMLTHSFRYARLGTYSSIFFVGFTAYAILKAHTFNLKIILTETAVVIIDVILAVQIFTSKSAVEALLRIVFALIIFYGSLLLVRSVQEEIRHRQEVQRLGAELEKANLRLQELDKMKSEFLSVASHELNSPMSVIKGYLHMILKEGFGKVDKEAKTYLQHVYSKTDQLAKLVSDLLNVSRIEQGRVKIDIQPTDIIESIEFSVEDYAIKAKEKNLTLNLHKPGISLPKVSADPDKLKEIMSNLLSNAIKYTKEGSVEVSVEKADSQIKVTVKDTGVGIPKEAQVNMFQKFYRVDNTWIREAGGTGLGLYITKGYLALMNGKIWFESEGENKGSTFYFTLPFAKAGDTHHEVKELTIGGKNERPDYTKSPENEIKENKQKIKEIEENNHNNKPKSLKEQLSANKQEREKMKEKILKQAEEYRKRHK